MNTDTIKNTLVPILTNRLDTLASASGMEAGLLSEQLDEVALEARLSCVDRLACEAQSIAVSSPQLRGSSVDQLRGLADRLANQLSYLEESLVVMEVDQVTPEVQMRSTSPRQEKEARTYFEVQVSRSGIALQRFERRAAEPRKAIAAVLTRDIFCRLCVDLVTAVHE